MCMECVLSIHCYKPAVATKSSWSKFCKSSLSRCSSKSIRSSSSAIEDSVHFVVSAKKSSTEDRDDLRGGRSLQLRSDLSVSRRSKTKSLRSFSSWMESWVLRAFSAMNLDTSVERGDSLSDGGERCVDGGDEDVSVVSDLESDLESDVAVAIAVADVVLLLGSLSRILCKAGVTTTEASFLLNKGCLVEIPTFLPNIFILLILWAFDLSLFEIVCWHLVGRHSPQ